MEEKEEIGSFLLVNIAAQRARQLMQGAPPLVRTTSRKPAAIAIMEVEKNLIPHFMPGDLGFVEPEADAEEEEE